MLLGESYKVCLNASHYTLLISDWTGHLFQPFSEQFTLIVNALETGVATTVDAADEKNRTCPNGFNVAIISNVWAETLTPMFLQATEAHREPTGDSSCH